MPVINRQPALTAFISKDIRKFFIIMSLLMTVKLGNFEFLGKFE